MIKKITFLVYIAFSLNTNAQVTNCDAAQVGTFELDSGEYGITRIERNKKTQTETNEFMGYKATYDVTWIDDCTYELRHKKILKGESPRKGNEATDVTKAEILKIEGAKIMVRLSSNYSTFVTECEITKIK